ncbi:septation protein A [Corallincola luteus]|uniref:Inner membrane-spanning protein YciB n=1 Tax=Corallincola luteus TaxID=1775177 RepID=A0ABY2AK69_9GAMM|nr:septation protein A [Corallincola luteus]TCI01811.1 septation protein A [Corallincola luteus]
MKQFIDFLPLIVFFAFYKLKDIYWATGALIITTGLQLAYGWFRHRKVEKMHLITFVLVTVFGGLTLILHDDVFIKWKVTVVNVLFFAALLISQYPFKKPLIKQMLGKELVLPDAVWGKINLGWAFFFLGCGLANIYVAFYMSQEVWVNFKVFGLLGLTLCATLVTGIYLFKHLPKEQPAEQNEGNE